MPSISDIFFWKERKPKYELLPQTEEIEENDREKIFKLLEASSIIDLKNKHERKQEVAEFLIENSEKISSEIRSFLNSEGDSILHVAVRNGHEDVVYWMTAHLPSLSGRLLEIKNNADHTPLHIAKNKGKPLIVEFFETHENKRVENLVLLRATNFVSLFFSLYRAELDRFSKLFTGEISDNPSATLKKISAVANTLAPLTLNISKTAIPAAKEVDSKIYDFKARPTKIILAHNVFGLFPLESANLETILVRTGILVFSRFEQYMVEGATWSNWARKLSSNLVPGCVDRIMNFHEINGTCESEREDMCHCFLEGNPTHSNATWRALDESGIVRLNKHEKIEYVKTKADCDTCKYGYRQLFQAEIEQQKLTTNNSVAAECTEILLEEEPWNKYNFHFTDETIEPWLQQFLGTGGSQNCPAENPNGDTAATNNASNLNPNPVVPGTSQNGLCFGVQSSSGELSPEDRQDIRQYLEWIPGSKPSLWIVYGAPAVGKQSLVSNYANYVYYEEHNTKANVLWIEGNCVELCFEKIYTILTNGNSMKVATMSWNWFKMFMEDIYARLKLLPTLIIFHQVNALESIERFLPVGVDSEHGFQIIITTDIDRTLDVNNLRRQFILNQNDDKGESSVSGQSFDFRAGMLHSSPVDENQPGTSSASCPSGRSHKSDAEIERLLNLDISSYILLKYHENFNISFKKVLGFTGSEAIEYISTALELPKESEEEIKELSELLDFSPMALAQVCKFIKSKNKNEAPSIRDIVEMFANKDWKNVHQILSLELSPAVGSVISKWNHHVIALQDEEPFGKLIIEFLRKLVYLNLDEFSIKDEMLMIIQNKSEVLAECFSTLAYYNIISQDETNPLIWQLNKMAKLVIQSELFMECSEDVYLEIHEFLRDLKITAETMNDEKFSKYESVIVGAYVNFETLMRKLLLHSEYDDAALSLLEEISSDLLHPDTIQKDTKSKSHMATGKEEKLHEELKAKKRNLEAVTSAFRGLEVEGGKLSESSHVPKRTSLTDVKAGSQETEISRIQIPTFGYSACATGIIHCELDDSRSSSSSSLLLCSPPCFKSKNIMQDIKTMEGINQIKKGLLSPKEATNLQSFRSTEDEEKDWLLKVLSKSLFGRHLHNFISLLENWAPSFTKLFICLLHGFKKSDSCKVKLIISQLNQANNYKTEATEFFPLKSLLETDVSTWAKEICLNAIKMQSEGTQLMEAVSKLEDDFFILLLKFAIGSPDFLRTGRQRKFALFVETLFKIYDVHSIKSYSHLEFLKYEHQWYQYLGIHCVEKFLMSTENGEKLEFTQPLLKFSNLKPESALEFIESLKHESNKNFPQWLNFSKAILQNSAPDWMDKFSAVTSTSERETKMLPEDYDWNVMKAVSVSEVKNLLSWVKCGNSKKFRWKDGKQPEKQEEFEESIQATAGQLHKDILNCGKTYLKEFVCRAIEIFDVVVEYFQGRGLTAGQKFSILSALMENKDNSKTGPSRVMLQLIAEDALELTAAGVAVVHCLHEVPTDIVCASGRLAEDLASKYEHIFTAFGFPVGHIAMESPDDRAKEYGSKVILYGEIADFQRDFLLDLYYQGNLRNGRPVQETAVVVQNADKTMIEEINQLYFINHYSGSTAPLVNILVEIWRCIHELKLEKHQILQDMSTRLETDFNQKWLCGTDMLPFVRRNLATWIDDEFRADSTIGCHDYNIINDKLCWTSKEKFILEKDSVIQQLLQLKASCEITPISPTGIYIFNATFLKKYKGLLALSTNRTNKVEREFMEQVYELTIALPSEKLKIDNLLKHVSLERVQKLASDEREGLVLIAKRRSFYENVIIYEDKLLAKFQDLYPALLAEVDAEVKQLLSPYRQRLNKDEYKEMKLKLDKLFRIAILDEWALWIDEVSSELKASYKESLPISIKFMDDMLKDLTRFAVPGMIQNLSHKNPAILLQMAKICIQQNMHTMALTFLTSILEMDRKEEIAPHFGVAALYYSIYSQVAAAEEENNLQDLTKSEFFIGEVKSAMNRLEFLATSQMGFGDTLHHISNIRDREIVTSTYFLVLRASLGNLLLERDEQKERQMEVAINEEIGERVGPQKFAQVHQEVGKFFGHGLHKEYKKMFDEGKQAAHRIAKPHTKTENTVAILVNLRSFMETQMKGVDSKYVRASHSVINSLELLGFEDVFETRQDQLSLRTFSRCLQLLFYCGNSDEADLASCEAILKNRVFPVFTYPVILSTKYFVYAQETSVRIGSAIHSSFHNMKNQCFLKIIYQVFHNFTKEHKTNFGQRRITAFENFLEALSNENITALCFTYSKIVALVVTEFMKICGSQISASIVESSHLQESMRKVRYNRECLLKYVYALSNFNFDNSDVGRAVIREISQSKSTRTQKHDEIFKSAVSQMLTECLKSSGWSSGVRNVVDNIGIRMLKEFGDKQKLAYHQLSKKEAKLRQDGCEEELKRSLFPYEGVNSLKGYLLDLGLAYIVALPAVKSVKTKFMREELLPASVPLIRRNYEVNHCLMETWGRKAPLLAPCPGKHCNRDMKYSWRCSNCLGEFQYGFDYFVYCDCGNAPVLTLGFRCTDSRHGNDFMELDDKQQIDFSGLFKPVKEINILLVGETTVKAWIEGVANCVNPEVFHNPLNNDTERGSDCYPKTYAFYSVNETETQIVRLIDTTEMYPTLQERLLRILSLTSRLSHINLVCQLTCDGLAGKKSYSLEHLEYSLGFPVYTVPISSFVHRREDNESQEVYDFNGVLKNLREGITTTLSPEDEEILNKSLQYFNDERLFLLKCNSGRKPVQIANIANSNNIHQLVVKLSRPIAEIIAKILTNKSKAEEEIQILEKPSEDFIKNVDQFRTRKRVGIALTETPFPFIVCSNKECFGREHGYDYRNKTCCFEKQTEYLMEQSGALLLPAYIQDPICNFEDCRHSSEDHFWLFYESAFYEESLQDDFVMELLAGNFTASEIKTRLIEERQKELSDYINISETLMNACLKFNDFLKLSPFWEKFDAVEYLSFLTNQERAKKKAHQETFVAYKETDKWVEIYRIMENPKNERRDSAEVKKIIDHMMTVEHTGKYLKDALEATEKVLDNVFQKSVVFFPSSKDDWVNYEKLPAELQSILKGWRWKFPCEM